MLFDPLDAIVGTRTRVRLLRALTPLDRPVGGREATRLAGVSHYAIAALEELVALGILQRQEGAGQHLFSFNRSHVLAGSLADLFAAEQRRTAALFAEIERAVEQGGGAESVAVFGSAARGEAEPGSDFDLLVLSGSETTERLHDALSDAAPALTTMFGVRLSPVVLTVEQARRQLAERAAFLTDALRDARRVAGRPLEDVLHG